jgi:flagellar hook assembly protein FlgD
LPFDGTVKLTVYNILGELVQELLNTGKSVGYHQVTWNAIDVPAGVYIYRLDAVASDNSQSFTDIKKMLLVK